MCRLSLDVKATGLKMAVAKGTAWPSRPAEALVSSFEAIDIDKALRDVQDLARKISACESFVSFTIRDVKKLSLASRFVK